MIQQTAAKPKVAFVASVYRHLAAFHKPYMEWFQHQGFEVHAYGQQDIGKEEVQNTGVICHDIPFQRSPFQLDNVRALKELTKSFQEELFQVVHVHTPVASVLGRIAAKKSNVPTVFYTAHGFHFFKGAPLKNWLTFYPVERLMAKYTDYLVTINEEDFRRAKRFPVKKEVLFVKGVGVDRQVYESGRLSGQLKLEKRQELGIGADEFVIICVAELSERKNQMQLIEALGKMRKDGPVKCLLVGNGESEEKLKAMVDQLNLKKTVQFLGFRRDVPDLIEIADTVTLLSKQEGLPRAIMEALAAAKPVVVTDVRGNSDLVIHGENGYAVELGNIDATVRAFESLMNSRDQLNKMGKKSRELSEEYDTVRIAKHMEKIYKKATHVASHFSPREEIG
ncbi:glycosyltransferase family 4 protein [Domibacillus iocasae]|uniref:Glycosyl transferase n=1 Tax=Domibacillus iocasae TaxID=1714016 RepID=A0A1E7DPH4_9BACI|nr:glycosyltransferase family 4 protein [Domibacillus iocasae]OES44982.1 hypothetical protein BA724_06880 [Domibacillus iocasae]